MYVGHDILVRQHAKRRCCTPCHMQTLSQYDWKIVKNNVKPILCKHCRQNIACGFMALHCTETLLSPFSHLSITELLLKETLTSSIHMKAQISLLLCSQISIFITYFITLTHQCKMYTSRP